jgi:predicted DNA-binding transcriptional regulator YafY
MSYRIVEPHRLILKGTQWYLQAYCSEKEQFRLFKLKRMKDLEIVQGKSFIRRELPIEARTPDQNSSEPPRTTAFVLCFQAEAYHLAEEWFGIEALYPMDDGSWLVRKAYTEDEWLYRFIFGLGHQVEVLEPPHLREVIADRAEQIAKKYRKDK